MKNTQALFYTVLILLSATLTKAAAEGTGDDQSHAPGKRAAKRLRSDGEEISLPISAAANLDRESDGDPDYNPDSDNPSFPKAGERIRRGAAASAAAAVLGQDGGAAAWPDLLLTASTAMSFGNGFPVDPAAGQAGAGAAAGPAALRSLLLDRGSVHPAAGQAGAGAAALRSLLLDRGSVHPAAGLAARGELPLYRGFPVDPAAGQAGAGAAAGPAAWPDLLLTASTAMSFGNGSTVHPAAGQAGSAGATAASSGGTSSSSSSSSSSSAGPASAAAAGAIGLMPSGDDDVVHLAASITEDNASTGSDVIGLLEDELPGLFDDY